MENYFYIKVSLCNNILFEDQQFLEILIFQPNKYFGSQLTLKIQSYFFFCIHTVLSH